MISKGNFSLRAPIYNPEKVVCIGMNYVDHCTEQNIPVPEEPVIFSKFGSAITEPNGDVVIPSISQVTNYPLGPFNSWRCLKWRQKNLCVCFACDLITSISLELLVYCVTVSHVSKENETTPKKMP